MERIVDFFIRRSLVVNIIAIFIILGGYFAVTSMKRNLQPQLEFPRIRVTVSLLGATPEEIEKYVTFPIEEVLKSLPGVEEITSHSSSGRTRITLHYPSSFGDEELLGAAELVRNQIDSIRYQLPTNIRSIQVKRVTHGGAFLFLLGIEGVNQSLDSHRNFFKAFERSLSQIKGIQAARGHYRSRDVYIELYPGKLKNNEISVTEVRRAIQQATHFAPIGEMQVNEDKYSIEISKTSDTLEQLARIPIRGNRVGNSLILKDIAKIGYRLEESRRITHVNGKPGISMRVLQDPQADSIDLKQAVMGIIEDYNVKAPPGVSIVPLIDGPRFLEQQLSVLTRNGALGFLLVFLILTFFLNWRTAFITSLGLPIAYFGTIFILHLMGFNLDLLSLVGMLLVIGLLVDDSIIISERYTENLEKGMEPKEAAGKSVKELMVPITGTVLTSVVAFSPMLFNQSTMGQLMLAIPMVVILALLLSWLESFFILPNHLSHFVGSQTPHTDLFNKMKKGYGLLLFLTLRFRYLVLIGAFGVIALAVYVAFHKVPINYHLRVRSNDIKVYAVLKESQSLEETYSKIKRIENYLLSFPKDKIQSVNSNVGRFWMNGRMYEGYRYAQVYGVLNVNNKYPSKLQKEVKSQVENFLKQHDKLDFEKLSVDLTRDEDNERKKGLVTVRIRGSEKVDFTEIESEIIEAAATAKEIGPHSPDPHRYQKAWKFIPQPKALVQYNLSSYDVGRQIRGVFTPDEVAEIRLEGEKVYVYTEMFKFEKPRFDQLGDYEVVTPSGSSVPLRFLGEWKKEKSLRQISHLNGLRDLNIDFEMSEEGGSLISARAALSGVLDPVVKKFPSYEIKVTEANREDTKSKNWAIKVAILCLVGVISIIILTLGSLTQPLLVSLPILFGGVGIIFALYFHQMEFGMMALVGFLGTTGVSVNASLVMVDHINKIIQKAGGKFSRELLIQGASSRLRAILLTTITTLGGVFPIAYSLGGESGFTQPLAFSVGWGISFATLLTLFVLPSLLQVREDFFWIGQRVLEKFGDSPRVSQWLKKSRSAFLGH